jgi:hypothetical protein
MPPQNTCFLRLLNLLRVILRLVMSPVLRRLSEHHTLSWAIGQTFILPAAVAVLEEVVFGILRLIIACLRWIFWSIRWVLVCTLVYFGKRLLLVSIVPQGDRVLQW